MKSRALLFAFLLFAACRSGTLDGNPSGSLCASTPVTCGGITCGPYEICDTTGASALCRCGLIAFSTTANATGCACSGTDPNNPGCGSQTSAISSEAQCFASSDMSITDGTMPDSLPIDQGGDLSTGPRQCASPGTPVQCGVDLCPTGAWCDISTPVCRCDTAAVGAPCSCNGAADPNNMGCLLGPASC